MYLKTRLCQAHDKNWNNNTFGCYYYYYNCYYHYEDDANIRNKLYGILCGIENWMAVGELLCFFLLFFHSSIQSLESNSVYLFYFIIFQIKMSSKLLTTWEPKPKSSNLIQRKKINMRNIHLNSNRITKWEKEANIPVSWNETVSDYNLQIAGVVYW